MEICFNLFMLWNIMIGSSYGKCASKFPGEWIIDRIDRCNKLHKQCPIQFFGISHIFIIIIGVFLQELRTPCSFSTSFRNIRHHIFQFFEIGDLTHPFCISLRKPLCLFSLVFKSVVILIIFSINQVFPNNCLHC